MRTNQEILEIESIPLSSETAKYFYKKWDSEKRLLTQMSGISYEDLGPIDEVNISNEKTKNSLGTIQKSL